MLNLVLFSKAAFLGAVQGLGEFLPISSTGHLIVFEKLFGLAPAQFGLSFDAFLHLGTLLALLWFFKDDLYSLVKGVIKEIKTHQFGANLKLAFLLIVGSIPAGFLGLLFESKIETAFRSPSLMAFALIGFSAIILLAETIAKTSRTVANLSPIRSFLIGLFQSLALIPGVSRSGASIVGGLLTGLSKVEAARFSFLLSIPVVAGAGLKKVLEISSSGVSREQILSYLIGLFFSSVTGFLAIKYFLKFLEKHGLGWFVVYRVGFGLLILLLIFFGKI